LGERRVSPLILHESVGFAAQLLESFEVVGGHLELEPSYNWDPGVYHLTVLRDPIERFLSHYTYVRQQPEAVEPFAMLAREHDIASLLRLNNEAVFLTVKDFYTRHFLGALLESDARRDALADDRIQVADLFGPIAARYNLIGVAERMNDVARVLCITLGLPASAVSPVRSTGERIRQSDLDADTVALLHELTARDRALYALAAERFDVVVHALGPAGRSPLPVLMPVSLREQAAASLPGHDAVAELCCPPSEINNCAISGEECVLSLRLDPGDTPNDAPIELRIINSLRQVVYRNNYALLPHRELNPGTFEILWCFVCMLGSGTYSCSFVFGAHGYDDLYQFGVVQRPTHWAGIVDLCPTIEVQGPGPDRSSLDGTISLPVTELRGAPGSLLHDNVVVSNIGTTPWRPHGRNRVVVSYKVRDEGGAYIVEDGLRTVLPCPIEPRQSRNVAIRIKAPGVAGRYTIEAQLVCEQIAWFGTSAPLVLVVTDSRSEA
jgi:hypothetical protein